MLKIFCRFFYIILNKKTKEKYTKNMKKHFWFSLFILFCFIFCGCSQSNPTASADDLDMYIASEIENNYNTPALDDETIKALSVIIRTKVKKENIELKKEYNISDEHILNIVKQTNGKVLKNNGELAYVDQPTSEDWIVYIKKYDLLKYLSEKNISVSSISSIEPLFSDDETLVGVVIGGKTISFEALSKRFNIPSNKIKDISNSLTDIKIKGTSQKNKFNVEESVRLSKNGMDFQGIINHFYGDFIIN